MAIQPEALDIRKRAYRLWEQRGRPDGDPEADWFEAESQLRSDLDDVQMPEPTPEELSGTMEMEAAQSAGVGAVPAQEARSRRKRKHASTL